MNKQKIGKEWKDIPLIEEETSRKRRKEEKEEEEINKRDPTKLMDAIKEGHLKIKFATWLLKNDHRKEMEKKKKSLERRKEELKKWIKEEWNALKKEERESQYYFKHLMEIQEKAHEDGEVVEEKRRRKHQRTLSEGITNSNSKKNAQGEIEQKQKNKQRKAAVEEKKRLERLLIHTQHRKEAKSKKKTQAEGMAMKNEKRIGDLTKTLYYKKMTHQELLEKYKAAKQKKEEAENQYRKETIIMGQQNELEQQKRNNMKNLEDDIKRYRKRVEALKKQNKQKEKQNGRMVAFVMGLRTHMEHMKWRYCEYKLNMGIKKMLAKKLSFVPIKFIFYTTFTQQYVLAIVEAENYTTQFVTEHCDLDVIRDPTSFGQHKGMIARFCIQDIEDIQNVPQDNTMPETEDVGTEYFKLVFAQPYFKHIDTLKQGKKINFNPNKPLTFQTIHESKASISALRSHLTKYKRYTK